MFDKRGKVKNLAVHSLSKITISNVKVNEKKILLRKVVYNDVTIA
jgi:hypothetical protein